MDRQVYGRMAELENGHWWFLARRRILHEVLRRYARLPAQPRVLEAGASVLVLDNLSRGDRSTLDGLDVEFIEGDIRDPEVVAPVMRGVDCVVHLAAY